MKLLIFYSTLSNICVDNHGDWFPLFSPSPSHPCLQLLIHWLHIPPLIFAGTKHPPRIQRVSSHLRLKRTVWGLTPGRWEMAVGGYLVRPFLFARTSCCGGLLSHMVEKSISRFARVLYKPMGYKNADNSSKFAKLVFTLRCSYLLTVPRG
jgi:hypothetical protein